MAKVIETLQRPALVHRAEQDPRRAALRRVQELLPRQCGRIFRQLLRLLPARGLRPAHRHLHREGKLGERGDRPHAPLGDAVAAGARRRDHRRVGLLPLRHRLGRDLFGDDLQPEEGRDARTSARSSASSSRCNTSATTRPSRAAISGCAATIWRSSRRTMRTPPGACQLLRRRDRGDRRVRPADRQEGGEPRQREGLRQLALCDARPDAQAGDGGDQA